MRELASSREPLRLGEDAFVHGMFRPQTIRAAINVLRDFGGILEAHRVDYVRAVATSATRETANGQELVDSIAAETGILIEVIDGLEEARLVLSAVSAVIDVKEKSALLIDMGGGSVEFTVARNGNASGCETIRMGPVRLLEQLRKAGLTEESVPDLLEPFSGVVEGLLEAQLGDRTPEICVGTGGCIQCLARLRVPLLGRRKTHKIMLGDLESFIPLLLATPIEKRLSQWGLKPDRADVIGIAVQVLHMVADEAGVKRIDVPQVGLRDGILAQMVREIRGPAARRRVLRPGGSGAQASRTAS